MAGTRRHGWGRSWHGKTRGIERGSDSGGHRPTTRRKRGIEIRRCWKEGGDEPTHTRSWNDREACGEEDGGGCTAGDGGGCVGGGGGGADEFVGQVSLSAFAFLFSELVQYSQQRVSNVEELEGRLKRAGQEVGERALEMLAWREKGTRKETQIVGTLSFVHTVVWKALFGRAADALEKGTQADNEYMIVDREPLVNRFISVPKDLGHLNCAAFSAGVVRGVLVAAGFPCQVSAHYVPQDGYKQRTVILIRFDESVLVREEMKL